MNHPVIVVPLEVLTDPRLTDPERRVLLALFSFRGKNTNTVWPKVETIAERAHIRDKNRVSKITTSLAKKGWLTKRKRGFSGHNEYEMDCPDLDSILASESNNDADASNAENTGDSSLVASETSIDGNATSILAPESNNEASASNGGNAGDSPLVVSESNNDANTSSMVAPDTSSKVASESKYREQTIEQTNEHTPHTPQGVDHDDDAVLFEELREHYPTKTDRKAAERAFAKLQPTKYGFETKRALVDALKLSIDERLAAGEWNPSPPTRQYIPHLATWLNGEKFLNEVIPRGGGAAGGGPASRGASLADDLSDTSWAEPLAHEVRQ